jgi:hypothetical protein
MFKKSFLGITLLAVAFLASRCAPTRVVRPLEKGEQQIGLSLGGPVIKFAGAAIPIPMTSLSYARGITGSLTAFGGVALTDLAFGNAHIDLGVTKGLLSPSGWRPGVSISPSLHYITQWKTGDARLYPVLDANAYWNVTAKNNTAYVGLSNWFELTALRPHGELQKDIWIPSTQFGYIFNGRGNMRYTLEGRYMAWFNDNVKLVPDYVSPTSTGALGIYFGINKGF